MRWRILAMALVMAACDDQSPVGPGTEVEIDRMQVEGLWGGTHRSGTQERIVCLKMVEPDSAAVFEMVDVDTEVGSGLIAASEGRWSYRPPHIDIELFEWGDPRGIPRLTAELGDTGRTLLLRVAYRQGDQFALGLTRASRCGRFFG